MKRTVPEILAPAGSYKAFMAAVDHGCDAVYLGGSKYGARAYAANFELEDIEKAIQYGHRRNVKLYYTINTLFKQKELEGLVEHVATLLNLGMDAFIIQDLGVLRLLRSRFPNIELHGSTQMNCHSLEGVRFLTSLGVRRVVLARELNINEIRTIIDHSDAEIETFVHGALCYCYSGQCLMSSFLGGRSGNRGRCAQPCRLKYAAEAIASYDLPDQLLSPKDIETLTILPLLIEAGIHSFKIEGRMKNPTYVGLMTSLYRRYTDLYLSGMPYEVKEDDLQDMMQIFSRRGYTQGYYQQLNGKNMMTLDNQANRQGLAVGTITSRKGPFYTLTLSEPIQAGDSLELSTDKGELITVVIGSDQNKTYVLEERTPLTIGSQVRRIKSSALEVKVEQSISREAMIHLRGKVSLKIGLPIELTLESDNNRVQVKGELVQQAKNQGLTEEKILKQLSKIDDYPIQIDTWDVQMDDEVFMPVSQLNQLRRDGFEALFHENRQPVQWTPYPSKTIHPIPTQIRNITVLLKNWHQFETIVAYDVTRIYVEWLNVDQPTLLKMVQVLKNRHHKAQLFLAMPKIMREGTKATLDKLMDTIPEAVEGFLVRSIDAYEQLKFLDKAIVWDYSLNCMNQETQIALDGPKTLTIMPSLELNKGELKGLNHLKSEVLIYGYPRTMTSAQCLRKTTSGCVVDQGHLFELSDRKEIRSTVETVCTLCYNNIYNGVPLYLVDQIQVFQALGISNYRIDLLNEPTTEILSVMEEAFLDQPRRADEVLTSFTRGHFNKGVE